jgi:hypothetical protein
MRPTGENRSKSDDLGHHSVGTNAGHHVADANRSNGMQSSNSDACSKGRIDSGFDREYVNSSPVSNSAWRRELALWWGEWLTIRMKVRHPENLRNSRPHSPFEPQWSSSVR